MEGLHLSKTLPNSRASCWSLTCCAVLCCAACSAARGACAGQGWADRLLAAWVAGGAHPCWRSGNPAAAAGAFQGPFCSQLPLTTNGAGRFCVDLQAHVGNGMPHPELEVLGYAYP